MAYSLAKEGRVSRLQQVEALCLHKGLQLTSLRRHVLEILSESETPLGAYTIMAQLARRERKTIAPPTVYRALDFFLTHGFVHKIESRNLFALCDHLDHAHHGLWLLCERCGHSEEIEAAACEALLAQTAAKAGFALQRLMLELHGLCQTCHRR